MLGILYEDKEKSEQAYRLAARGEFNLSSAMYYNDQPPQMMYYSAKAILRHWAIKTRLKRD